MQEEFLNHYFYARFNPNFIVTFTYRHLQMCVLVTLNI